MGFRIGLLWVGVGLLAGCSSLPSGKGWGQGATLRPGWDRIRGAAWNSVSSPSTWAPVGAALLLQIDGADERLSDWAAEHNPVFGAPDSAGTASDILVSSSLVLWGATVLAVPSGDGGYAKLKGVGVQSSALFLTLGTTELLKAGTQRTRPNGEDSKSFPSGHTSMTAASSVLASRNVEHLQLPGWSKVTLKTGFFVLPYATGWARVEAAQHYPSDVLVGAALGTFLGTFVNDAFMGADSAEDLQVMLDYLPGETFIVGFTRRF